MPTCCICLNLFEGEDPPILAMSGYGRAMVLCPECAALVERVAGTEDSLDRDEAIEELSSFNINNRIVRDTLVSLISREGEQTECPEEETGEAASLDETETAAPNEETDGAAEAEGTDGAGELSEAEDASELSEDENADELSEDEALFPELEKRGSNMSLYIALALGLTAVLVAVLLRVLN